MRRAKTYRMDQTSTKMYRNWTFMSSSRMVRMKRPDGTTINRRIRHQPMVMDGTVKAILVSIVRFKILFFCCKQTCVFRCTKNNQNRWCTRSKLRHSVGIVILEKIRNIQTSGTTLYKQIPTLQRNKIDLEYYSRSILWNQRLSKQCIFVWSGHTPRPSVGFCLLTLGQLDRTAWFSQ